MVAAWVCLGAALGAPTRYLVDRYLRSRHDSAVPWGTLAVNVAGSLVAGVLVGAATHLHVPVTVVAGVATGFCGALTTYSTFAYEAVRLAGDGERLLAVAYVVGSLAAGLAAVSLGYLVGQAW